MASPPIKKYVWVYINVLLFLLVLARLYAYAITYNIVPDFPDPVLAFLAKLNTYTDMKLDPIAHVIGPLVFGICLKWYNPKHAGHSKAAIEEKKEEPAAKQKKGKAVAEKEPVEEKKPKSSRGTLLDGKRQYIIILGRLVQCGIFISRECLPLVNGCREKTCVGDCSRRVFDFVVSAALAYAELHEWNWDGGFIDAGLVKLWHAIGRGTEGEKVEEKEEEVIYVAGPKRNVKSLRD